ncbi:hypothetical protein AS026_13120 [Rhizobium altiplani]|uniref:Uncharacterized protein n=1 Tax=Rhizobium altiplani TaxID=1864509 RepID=A0A109JF14_9HYPH|nr:hypothetical protein [Rhizobium altiplani]KWV47709.1 hypothetical protein AS026_13120 [Rhizobium altiplani]
MTRAPGRKVGKSLNIVASMLVMLCVSLGFNQATGAVARAQETQTPLDEFPFIVMCKVKSSYLAFHLSRVTKDHTAIYLASDNIVGKITLHGHAEAVNGAGGGDCLGKTLDQLRSSGQARFLKSE